MDMTGTRPGAAATPPGIGFARLFDYPTRFFPDKTAVVDGQSEATFSEVDAMANGVAATLCAAGASPGDRVALILPNCIPFIAAEIAIARCGMVKVPLNIRFHVEEVLYALGDCEPAILVCAAEYAREHAGQLARVPSLKRVIAVGEPVEGCIAWADAIASRDAFRPAGFAPDDPILIRYTGGTTGRAKGIVHTAESLLAIHLDVLREFAFRQDEVALHLGHLSHGINFMWAALYAAGATQVLHERFDPKAVLAEIERRRVTYTYMVPTMIYRLLREDDGASDVSSLRSFMYASAPMPVPLLRQAIARFGSIFTQVYTLSEAPVVTTIMRPDEHLDIETQAGNRLASCGREVVTMQLRLIDDDGAEIAEGEVGEIAVRSRNNMACYWRLPDETARTLVDCWIRTGDMARRDEDGFLYIVDRKKDMIITGALNVYPKEVEDVLHAHSAVAQAAVIGVPDEEWGEAIRAYVVPKPGRTATAAELIEHCRGRLAGYKKPREVLFVESLPLSPVGKISRAELRRQARSAQARPAAAGPDG
jgi:acyl-CoA synthetase (AMP-forming)/AMP-acid ligase II